MIKLEAEGGGSGGARADRRAVSPTFAAVSAVVAWRTVVTARTGAVVIFQNESCLKTIQW